MVVPATATLPGPVTLTTADAGCTDWSNVADTAVLTATFVAPAAGDCDSTDGPLEPGGVVLRMASTQ